MQDPREKYLAQLAGGRSPRFGWLHHTSSSMRAQVCPLCTWAPLPRPTIPCQLLELTQVTALGSLPGIPSRKLVCDSQLLWCFSAVTYPFASHSEIISDPVYFWPGGYRSSDQFCSKFSTRLSQLGAWVPVVLLFLSFFLFLSWIISHECEVLTSHIRKHSSRRPSHTHGPQWHWDRLVSVTSGS